MMETEISHSKFLELILKCLRPDDFKSIAVGRKLKLINCTSHGTPGNLIYTYTTNEVTLEYKEHLRITCMVRFREMDGGRAYINILEPTGRMKVNHPYNPVERYVILN